ncbi:lipopolysaccharide biosynthesis protein [Pseudomonas sp. SWRI154]|uniref:lipopolysaccharide biosynthesis protein n=1 Tax=Pseudomonas sp. SWRI154 TaxID=2745501 RepID=UPI001EE23DD9|nr:lipopolysaccharide biosynthesis protein [Pseudomonas sp. SWRI154]
MSRAKNLGKALIAETAASFKQTSFSECKNIKSGPVFIIASGNSARGFPIEEFSTLPMITMNGAISMFSQAGTKPFFYICSDTNFPLQQPELFATAMQISENVALWEEQFDIVQIKPSGKVFSLKKAPRASIFTSLFNPQKSLVRDRSFFSKRSKDIGFSKDMTLGYFDARTVMYLALQIAYHLGFNKVFLVGFDLNQAAGRFYETSESNRSPCGLDQHYDTRILPSLKLMCEHIVSDNFQVYNLSADSRVPAHIIEKISLDDARRMLNR